MKKISWLLFLLFSQIITVSDLEMFLQGNKHFFDGQFNKARNCYEKIPQKSSAVWHNIGNCYYNENNCSKALVCWRRAVPGADFQQLGELFESERLVLEKFNCLGDTILMRSIKRVVLVLPKLLMQFLLLICLILFLTLCYQCLFKKRKQYRSIPCKKKYLICLLLSTVVLLLLLAAKEKFLNEKLGVITNQKVSVHVGPEKSFHQKMVLPLGCIVQVEDKQNNMVKVICPQGSGWIVSDNLEIV